MHSLMTARILPCVLCAGSVFRYSANYGAVLGTVNSTTATFRFFSIGGANAYSGFQVRVPTRHTSIFWGGPRWQQ